MEAALADGEYSHTTDCEGEEVEAGICLKCGTTCDITDKLDELIVQHPELGFVLPWARCGISERSSDLMRDHYELLKEARKLAKHLRGYV